MALIFHHFEQEVRKKNLSSVIIIHEYPLSKVDHYGFRKFYGTIQHFFKMVSKNNIKRDIMNIYDVEKKKTIKLLNKTFDRIVITCDL